MTPFEHMELLRRRLAEVTEASNDVVGNEWFAKRLARLEAAIEAVRKQVMALIKSHLASRPKPAVPSIDQTTSQDQATPIIAEPLDPEKEAADLFEVIWPSLEAVVNRLRLVGKDMVDPKPEHYSRALALGREYIARGEPIPMSVLDAGKKQGGFLGWLRESVR